MESKECCSKLSQIMRFLDFKKYASNTAKGEKFLNSFFQKKLKIILIV